MEILLAYIFLGIGLFYPLSKVSDFGVLIFFYVKIPTEIEDSTESMTNYV